MEDIFISYSKADVKAAKELARTLTDAGLSVWWDNLLSPGDFFGDVITGKIGSARVVVVLWTEDSVRSKWVHAEASLALSQDKLVPVKGNDLDFDKIPLPFNTLHSIDISSTDELTKHIADKLDVSEQVHQQIAKKRQLNKRLKAVLITIPAAILMLSLVAYYSVAGFRQSINQSVYLIKDYFSPCAGIDIQIVKDGSLRNQCVASDRFEGFTFKDCDRCPEMVVIPEGRFVIGSSENEIGRDLDEGPQKEITLNAFAVGKYEITKAQWNGCVDDGDCRIRPDHTQVITDSHPISYISWNDAVEYTQWLSKKTNMPYRLPTEAEWEYAARAGDDSARYWGYNASEACKFANVSDDSHQKLLTESQANNELTVRETIQRRLTFGEPHKCDDKHALLSRTGLFRPNNYQLFDMIGNVWEWVEDCAFPNYEAVPLNGEAYREKNCKVSGLRGGSYASGPASARSANRFQGGRSKAQFQPDYGFRVVRDL
jgi:formylglycine-generating enzyme required for sulfatase activity